MNFSLQKSSTIAFALSMLVILKIPGMAQPTPKEKICDKQNVFVKTISGSPVLVTAAVKCYDNGDYEQARQLLEQAFLSGHYDAHVCYYAAHANRKCGILAGILATITRAILYLVH